MLVPVNNGADGRPRVWRMTTGDIRLHVTDLGGEVAVFLGEVGIAAGLKLPEEVHLVPAPWREIAALLAEHATQQGVAVLYAMANHIALAAGVTDKQELLDGLLQYFLIEEAHPAGGVRLVQGLGFGPRGLAQVMAERELQRGVTLH